MGRVLDHYKCEFKSSYLNKPPLRPEQKEAPDFDSSVSALGPLPEYLKRMSASANEDWSTGISYQRPPLPPVPEVRTLAIRAIKQLPVTSGIDLNTEDGFHQAARGVAAVYIAMAGDEPIYNAFDTVCCKFNGYDPYDNRERFDRFCREVRDKTQSIGAYWLFRAVGLESELDALLHELQVMETEVDYASSEPDSTDMGDEVTPLDSTSLGILQLPPAAELVVRPRPTLWGPYLQRRSITMLGGAGGTGKSVFKLVWAVSVAIGRDLLGLTNGLNLPPPRKVLVINNEDDADELLRRLVGIKVHYQLTDAEYELAEQNLYYRSGTTEPVKLAFKLPQEKYTLYTSKWLGRLEDYCRENAIDVVCADPLVSLHAAQENDNGEMDQVMQIAKKLAANANIALLLVHHTRKDAAAGNVDDAFRGASAIVNAARGVILLTRMSRQESEKLDIGYDERTRYFRMDFGKYNYGLPPSEATWFRNESVTLDASPDPDDPDSLYQNHIVSVGIPSRVALLPIDPDDSAKTTAQQFVAALHNQPWPLKVADHYAELKLLCCVADERTVRRRLEKVIPTLNEDDKTAAVAIIHDGRAYRVWCEKHSRADGIALHREELVNS